MTEQELKDFFIISKKDEEKYDQIRKNFTEDQLSKDLEPFVVELLKSTFKCPLSFMDEGKEELFTLSEDKTMALYRNYAQEILEDYYEDFYDFTQELSDCLSNFPE